MRVSDYYKLNLEQASIDFVNIDIENDIKAFIDPRALRLLPSEWGNSCVSSLQDFFRFILSEISSNPGNARKLLSMLHEPNETHLGFSVNKSLGKALGIDKANLVWLALSGSQAVKSGLLEDLEDTILMIEGVGPDLISDMTTNIIRGNLIKYTQDICGKYGIPTEEVSSGPIWNSIAHKWEVKYVQLPNIRGRRLLLVPKIIIRKKMDYDEGEYYRHYILEYLQEVELSSNSELVQLLKNETKRVTKKSLIRKYGVGKEVVARVTKEYPEILNKYRVEKNRSPRMPLSHEQLSELEDIAEPDWSSLIDSVEKIPVGTENSHLYEKAIEKLLTALFYPNLAFPISQAKIHDGRKRIDITFTNVMNDVGFFSWLGKHYTAPNIFIECKNYGKEVGNPELDQLSGRFSPSRGKFGILVCRQFQNRNLFLSRCKDTVNDSRGYTIPLDDHDLRALVELRKDHDDSGIFNYLKSTFDNITM